MATTPTAPAQGRPLEGIRVLELAGLAPGPFAGMVLADFGADVVRVDRNGTSFNVDVLSRNKRSISVSLKSLDGVSALQTLLSAPPAGCSKSPCGCSAAKTSKCAGNQNKDLWRADILIDPFRPGVLERLGLGPKELMKRNPGLIIARLTGFRREGPYAKMAGHDINYMALSGVLAMLGRKDGKPYSPANIVADFGGGGMMAVVGILMALLERNRSGKGQVVEVDMVTGTRYLSSFPLMMSRPSLGIPIWDQPRGENLLDGGAPWYEVYETSDGGYMSCGAMENPFYVIFLNILLGALPPSLVPSPPPSAADQQNRETWPALEAFFTTAFASQSRTFWSALFLNTDACCVPVLNPSEVDSHGRGPGEPNVKISDIEEGDGGVPGAAPRLGRTPAGGAEAYEEEGEGFFLTPGAHTREVLREAGLGEKVEKMLKEGAVESSEEIKAKL